MATEYVKMDAPSSTNKTSRERKKYKRKKRIKWTGFIFPIIGLVLLATPPASSNLLTGLAPGQKVGHDHHHHDHGHEHDHGHHGHGDHGHGDGHHGGHHHGHHDDDEILHEHAKDHAHEHHEHSPRSLDGGSRAQSLHSHLPNRDRATEDGFNHEPLRNKNKPNAFAVSPYDSDFSCKGRVPGYYADMQLSCEVYHLCNRHGGGMAFECPRGTRFQQRTMVCNHWNLVDCEKSADYYDNNLRIGQRNLKLIDDPVFMQVMVKETPRQRADGGPGRRPRPTKAAAATRQNKSINEGFMQVVVKQTSAKRPERPIQASPEGWHVHKPRDPAPKITRPTWQERLQAQQQRRQQRKSQNQRRQKTKKNQRGRGKNSFEDIFFKDLPQENKARGFRQAKGKAKPGGGKTSEFPNFPSKEQKAPVRFLEPPPKEAPVANFVPFTGPRPRNKPLRSFGRRKKKNRKRVQSNSNPLGHILPSNARVVGVKPLRSLALSNRENSPNILTLDQFLQKLPHMSNVQAIPVQVGGAHVDLIENLAQQTRASPKPFVGFQRGQETEFELQELDDLIANREARRIKGLKRVPVKPRGGGPSSRFVANNEIKGGQAERKPSLPSLDLLPPQNAPAADFSPPGLEFGFVPVTEQSTTLSGQSTATSPVASNAKSSTEDAFFFTTTEASAGGTGDQDKDAKGTGGRGKKGTKAADFDMRNLFFIPSDKSKSKRKKLRFSFSP